MKDPFLKFIIAAFIAVILSLFISSDATAQESITADTTYIVQRGDTLFQVKSVVYSTGKKVTEENPIGRDTSSALNELRQQAYNLSQQFAGALLITENAVPFRRTIAGFSSSINMVVGRTYYQEIGNILTENLLGGYSLRVNGAEAVTGQIIKNAQGLLRLRIAGTNYPVDAFSENLIYIKNYAGDNFFLVRPGIDGKRWTGGGRKYILTKTNQR